MDTLSAELGWLGAQAIVLGIAVELDDIGRDGWPRASAKPRHPGVQVFFDSRYGPLVYQCDMFRHWQQNVRAIALTLQRLRMAELYGCTRRGEQYQGFKALPAPQANGDDFGFTMAERKTRAAFFLAKQSDMDSSEILASADHREAAFRTAAKRLHPDVGGNAEDFKKLQTARKLLTGGAQ